MLQQVVRLFITTWIFCICLVASGERVPASAPKSPVDSASDGKAIPAAARNQTAVVAQKTEGSVLGALLQETQLSLANATVKLNSSAELDERKHPGSRHRNANQGERLAVAMTAKGSVLRAPKRVLLQEDEALRHDKSVQGTRRTQAKHASGMKTIRMNLSEAIERNILKELLARIARSKIKKASKAVPAAADPADDPNALSDSEVISELMDNPNASDAYFYDGDHRYVITIPNKMLYPVDEAVKSLNSYSPMAALLLALGGGTGASIGGTGSLLLDRDLARRMRLQDEAVMILLLGVYFVTLFFSASLAYRQATNSSPVTYYADPRYYTNAVEGNDIEAFIDTFGQPPKSVLLRVAGFTPIAEETPGSVQWRGESYNVNFTFALDLSPWVVRQSDLSSLDDNARQSQLQDGIVVDDLVELQHNLEHDRNDLATVDMCKEVSWSNWEELATNIKSQIRQCGFDGVIGIERTQIEHMVIYKNRPWANFMHSKTLKVILALSIVGWAVYIPYLWSRTTKLLVRSFYTVDIDINDYWRLIRDNLSSNGFDVPEDMGGSTFTAAMVAAAANAEAAWSSEGDESEAEQSEDAASNAPDSAPRDS